MTSLPRKLSNLQATIIPAGFEWLTRLRFRCSVDTIVVRTRSFPENDSIEMLKDTCGAAHCEPIRGRTRYTGTPYTKGWRTYITRPTKRTFELAGDKDWWPSRPTWEQVHIALDVTGKSYDGFEQGWSWFVEHAHLKHKRLTCKKKWVYLGGRDYGKLPEFPDGDGTIHMEDFKGKKQPARAMKLYQKLELGDTFRLEVMALNPTAVERGRLDGIYKGGIRVDRVRKFFGYMSLGGGKHFTPFNPRRFIERNVSFRELDPAFVDEMVAAELARQGERSRDVPLAKREAIASELRQFYRVERGVIVSRKHTIALPKAVHELIFGLIPTTLTIPE